MASHTSAPGNARGALDIDRPDRGAYPRPTFAATTRRPAQLARSGPTPAPRRTAPQHSTQQASLHPATDAADEDT